MVDNVDHQTEVARSIRILKKLESKLYSLMRRLPHYQYDKIQLIGNLDIDYDSTLIDIERMLLEGDTGEELWEFAKYIFQTAQINAANSTDLASLEECRIGNDGEFYTWTWFENYYEDRDAAVRAWNQSPHSAEILVIRVPNHETILTGDINDPQLDNSTLFSTFVVRAVYRDAIKDYKRELANMTAYRRNELRTEAKNGVVVVEEGTRLRREFNRRSRDFLLHIESLPNGPDRTHATFDLFEFITRPESRAVVNTLPVDSRNNLSRTIFNKLIEIATEYPEHEDRVAQWGITLYGAEFTAALGGMIQEREELINRMRNPGEVNPNE